MKETAWSSTHRQTGQNKISVHRMYTLQPRKHTHKHNFFCILSCLLLSLIFSCTSKHDAGSVILESQSWEKHLQCEWMCLCRCVWDLNLCCPSSNSSNAELLKQKTSDVTVYVRCDISEQYIWIMLLSPNMKKHWRRVHQAWLLPLLCASLSCTIFSKSTSNLFCSFLQMPLSGGLGLGLDRHSKLNTWSSCWRTTVCST